VLADHLFDVLAIPQSGERHQQIVYVHTDLDDRAGLEFALDHQRTLVRAADSSTLLSEDLLHEYVETASGWGQAVQVFVEFHVHVSLGIDELSGFWV